MFRSITLFGLLSFLAAPLLPDLGAIIDAIPDNCQGQWDAAFNCVIGKILFGCGDLLGLADSFGNLDINTVTCLDLQCLSCAAYGACPDCESEFTALIGCIKTEIAADMSAIDAIIDAAVVNVTDANATGCDEMMMMDSMNMTDMDMNMTDCFTAEDAGIAIDPELLECAIGDELECTVEFATESCA
ncbi:MAG: hypothetical protein SGARI_007146 [Bacillariaceae sp.]